MTPALTSARAMQAMAATWPPAAVRADGPFLIREGRGGGSRVESAVATGPATAGDIARAEAAMRALGQRPLFQITPADAALDAALAARFYAVLDPVVLRAAPVASLAAPRPPMTTFEVWPPLAAQVEIWAEGGVGPARLAVMDRAAGPKVTLLGRVDDHPAGTAFVACDGDIAMIHAVEVATRFRRRGLARHLMAAAAGWAARQGAVTLALAVTRANGPANALYASLGLGPVAEYHYRRLTE